MRQSMKSKATKNVQSFELFERPVGTMSLLVYLREFGPADMSTARKKLGLCRKTFYNAAKRLHHLGFVYVQKESTFPPRKMYSLTRKGEEAADRLIPFAELIDDTAASLERELEVLEKEGKEGTVERRLELLAVISETCFDRGKWDDALDLASRRLELARQKKNVSHEIAALLILGEINGKRGEMEASNEFLLSASELAGKEKRHDIASQASLLLGVLSENAGDLESAQKLYEESLVQAERAGDEVRTTLARLATGRLLGRRGELKESYDVLTGVVDDLERLGNTEELPRAYASLGATAFRLARPEALGWFEKASEAALREGDVRIEAYAKSNAAAYLTEDGDYKKAGKYLDEAETIFAELGEQKMFAGVELNRAILSGAMGKWREAENRFSRALELAREAKKRGYEAHILFNWGQMEKKRNDVGKAKRLLSKALEMFQGAGEKERALRCENELKGL